MLVEAAPKDGGQPGRAKEVTPQTRHTFVDHATDLVAQPAILSTRPALGRPTPLLVEAMSHLVGPPLEHHHTQLVQTWC